MPPAGSVVELGPLQVVRVPALVRGRVVVPAPPRVDELRAARSGGLLGPTETGSYLLTRPLVDRSTLQPDERVQVLVTPVPDPHDLVEPDPTATARVLGDLRLDDVLDLVRAVGEALSAPDATATARRLLGGSSELGDRAHRALLGQLTGMFDPARVEQLVDRELATPDAAGRAYVDGWGPVDAGSVPGVAARLGSVLGVASPDRPPVTMRAAPTRQLHVTAGNAGVVPAVSLLWAWASRGAAVVKVAADAVPLLAVLVDAVARAGAGHPLVDHTSLVYWPGGEPSVEDVLLADGAFDRRVVWGSDAAAASVTSRGAPTDTVLLTPRYGVSILAREALEEDLAGVARRAAVDSMISNQAACTASLLHLVEGDPERVAAYCRCLADALREWDDALPYRPSGSSTAALAALRRGRLSAGRWYVNGSWPQVRSAIVDSPAGLDLRRHPGGRLVVVRGVRDLDEAAAEVTPRVGVVGVAGEPARTALRDDLVSRGADAVVPLGAAEDGYAGRPQDGMRVVARLVRWVTG